MTNLHTQAVNVKSMRWWYTA